MFQGKKLQDTLCVYTGTVWLPSIFQKFGVGVYAVC